MNPFLRENGRSPEIGDQPDKSIYSRHMYKICLKGPPSHLHILLHPHDTNPFTPWMTLSVRETS